jgi:conjugal transfer pilus assembly protein TraW
MRCRSSRTGNLRHVSFWVMALLELGWGCPVHAEEDWLSRSRAILDAVGKQPKPAWLETRPSAPDIRKQAMDALQAAQKPQLKASATVSSPGQDGFNPDSGINSDPGRKTFVIYASTSLGEAGLLDILEEAAGRDDVLVVFRGMKPGQKLQQLVREIHALVRRFGEDRQPHVVIDPNRFRHANVTAAPTLTLEESGRVLAKVQGITGIQWLQSKTDGKLGNGKQDKGKPSDGGVGSIGSVGKPPRGEIKTLDFGIQGPTRVIAEVDLIEEMQRRVMQIDWVAKKREALIRFWERTEFYDLPEATENRERLIDPSVTAPRDVVAPDGTMIVRAGQRINPLDRLPFTQRLVVFDATSPAQVEFALRMGREAAPRRVTYIVTRLDRESGWEGLEKIETALNAPVYLLTPDLRDRFQLERSPATVEAKGKNFAVREFKVGKAGQGLEGASHGQPAKRQGKVAS